MYKHIMIATDGSDVAQKGIDQGLSLAKALGAKVTGITTTEMWAALEVAGADGQTKIENYERAAAEQAQRVLAGFKNAAEAVGVACDTLHVPDASPADGIVASAEKLGCDLIVMGTHGRRGIEKLLYGSEAQGVITHTHLPVLVCR